MLSKIFSSILRIVCLSLSGTFFVMATRMPTLELAAFVAGFGLAFLNMFALLRIDGLRTQAPYWVRLLFTASFGTLVLTVSTLTIGAAINQRWDAVLAGLAALVGLVATMRKAILNDVPFRQRLVRYVSP